jgi:hypothetical protein
VFKVLFGTKRRLAHQVCFQKLTVLSTATLVSVPLSLTVIRIVRLLPGGKDTALEYVRLRNRACTARRVALLLKLTRSVGVPLAQVLSVLSVPMVRTPLLSLYRTLLPLTDIW